MQAVRKLEASSVTPLCGRLLPMRPAEPVASPSVHPIKTPSRSFNSAATPSYHRWWLGSASFDRKGSYRPAHRWLRL